MLVYHNLNHKMIAGAYLSHRFNEHNSWCQHIDEGVLARAVVPWERVVVVVEAFHAEHPYGDVLPRVQ